MVSKHTQAIWTISTVIFIVLMLIVGVIAQSNYRSKQRDQLLSEIYSSSKAFAHDPKKLAESVIANREKIEFINNNKPIVNIRLRSVPVSASIDDISDAKNLYKWCSDLKLLYLNSNEVAVSHVESAEWIRESVDAMRSTYGCGF